VYKIVQNKKILVGLALEKGLLLGYDLVMISSNTTQIKLNLPSVLKVQLEEIAKSFGFTVSAYLRHLVLMDVGEKKYPTFKVSEKTEDITRKAFKDNKWVEVDDISDYFKSLK